MKTFKDYIKSLNACKPAVEWAGDKPIEQVVAECHRGDWLLWLAQKCGVELQSLTLAKGHCANTVRHLMIDQRSVKAVDMAIAFGEGRVTVKQLDEVAAAAAAAAASFAVYDSDAFNAAFAAASFATNAANAASFAVNSSDTSFTVNLKQTADICRKYIGELIIEKVTQPPTPNP